METNPKSATYDPDYNLKHKRGNRNYDDRKSYKERDYRDNRDRNNYDAPSISFRPNQKRRKRDNSNSESDG